MNLREHDEWSHMKVWLSENEVEHFLSAAKDTEQRIAFAFEARCGLRSAEWLDVSPRDVAETDAGTMLRVWEGKGDKFCETPMPPDLTTMVRTAADYGNTGPDDPILSVSSTRTLRRWVSNAGAELSKETGEPGWNHLTTHDLRRTWATALADAEVDPLLALAGAAGST